MPRSLLCLPSCILCLILISFHVFAQTPPPTGKDLKSSLIELRERSTLTEAAMPPWHLTIHFDRGALLPLPAESGTLDMWWTSPAESRIVLTGDGITAVRVRGNVGISTSARTIPAIDLDLLSIVVEPFISLGKVEDLVLRPHNEAYAGETLHCVSATEIVVCPAPDGQSLRLIRRWAAQTILVSRSGNFHGKSLPVAMQVAEGKVLFARIEIKQLSTFNPADLPPLPAGIDLTQTESICDHPASPPRLREGLTSGVAHFNEEARRPGDLQGATVLLRYLVLPSGKPSQFEVLESNSEDWANSTIERLQHEIFIPAEAPGGRKLTCPTSFRFNYIRR